MSRIIDTYRVVHEQGFMPIFVDNGLDSKMLVEACINAGVKSIEYTLRRSDAHIMIPWIRQNCPDLFLLVGSTLDDVNIVSHCRKRYPQLLTVAELDDMDVDGFVSMIGWSQASIRKYSPTRIIIPTASTTTEAFQQTAAGAHFIKMLGSDITLVKKCRAEPVFDYCPIFITGGQNPETIPDSIASGALLIGSGFDLILKGMSDDITCKQVTERLKVYLDITRESRAKYWPETVSGTKLSNQEWLNTLSHYHPFT
jgi:2-keto-3-deoxy-6-phosphogluconate aldolase